MKLKGTIAVAGASFVVDQASKLWILYGLDLPSLRVAEVWPPYLNLIMAWNRGANFGLGDSMGAAFWIGLAVAISVALLIWARRLDDPVRLVGIGMVIGGALGNAMDRVLYGAVVDFLNTSCCGFRNPYAFNVADVLIFVGAAALILREGRPQKKA